MPNSIIIIKKAIIFGCLCLVTLLLGACFPVDAMAPSAQATLQTTAGMPVERVFGCAEQRLAQLGAINSGYSNWYQPVTLRDISSATLETGHFPGDNIMGFRLHLHYRSANGVIELRIKGVGPYYTDLGVDKAINDFEKGFEKCLISTH